MVASCLRNSTTIMVALLSFTIASAKDDEYDFLTSSIEKTKIFENVKFRTMSLGDGGKTCKPFTSYVYSTAKGFYLTTPTYDGFFYANATSQYQTSIFITRQACRLVLDVTKYIVRDGIEVKMERMGASLGAPSVQKLNDFMDDLARSSDNPEHGSTATTPSNQKSKAHADHDDTSTITSNKLDDRMPLGAADPNLVGIGDTGAVFSSRDATFEYSGMFYCTEKICSIYLTQADEFSVSVDKDQGGVDSGFEISGHGQKLSIRIHKQVFEDGWKEVNR